MRVGDRHCIKRLWEGVSANEIDETSTEEALHQADPDEAQAAARRHRRLCFAFNARITTDEEGRTSETDPEEEALYEADPDEAQGSPGHHSAKAVPEVV